MTSTNSKKWCPDSKAQLNKSKTMWITCSIDFNGTMIKYFKIMIKLSEENKADFFNLFLLWLYSIEIGMVFCSMKKLIYFLGGLKILNLPKLLMLMRIWRYPKINLFLTMFMLHASIVIYKTMSKKRNKNKIIHRHNKNKEKMNNSDFM